MRPSTKRKLLRVSVLGLALAGVLWFFSSPQEEIDDDPPPFRDHQQRVDSRVVVNRGNVLIKNEDNLGEKKPGFQQPKSPADSPSSTSKSEPQVATETTTKYVDKLTAPHDYRDKECVPEYERLSKLPVGTLPNTSVIFCFCNEPAKSLHFSMLSVIERSPRYLLHEIILVDDGSNAPHIQEPLEEFAKTLPVPVIIVRQGYRSGLMRARVAGARAATGQTLTFLDSHISCSIGWLEPMMYRISQDWQNVVMPKIDAVDRDFNYKPGGVELVGFNSRLTDHGIQLQKAHDFQGRTAVDPQPSPAMAGGLFSVSRAYFFHIGAFDEGMLHWGGENIEIGFRVWQCGGRIEMIPCSRIAHVWGGMGAGCGWPGKSPGNVNKWRAIDVWMDNYTTFMEEYLPRPENGIGNISLMLDLRKKLNCKSFQWFLDNVYPECWITVILSSKRSGILRNEASRKCIDPRHEGGPAMIDCRTGAGRNGNNQFFWHTAKDELRLNIYGADMDLCIESPIPASGFKTPQKLFAYGCHGYHGNQEFIWNEEEKTISHASGCLESSGNTPQVAVCDGSTKQKWQWLPP